MPETDRVLFLADENFDLNIVKLLRKAVILTEDKDFGKLVYRLRLPHYGILLIRPMKTDPPEKAVRVIDSIRKHINQLPSAFAVLSSDSFRIKSLSKS